MCEIGSERPSIMLRKHKNRLHSGSSTDPAVGAYAPQIPCRLRGDIPSSCQRLRASWRDAFDRHLDLVSLAPIPGNANQIIYEKANFYYYI